MLPTRFLSHARLPAYWLGAVCWAASFLSAQDGTSQQRIDFIRDIRPILSDNCFACHGPDPQTRQAGLRLDTEQGMMDEANPVVIAGEPDVSLLVERIESEEPGFQMPPASFGRTLSDEQRALIRGWVVEGAQWSTHWAFQPVEKPPVPSAPPGAVRNPIDNFVLARMHGTGLSPSPPADKATLLRRLSFDLTGLPPSLEELDTFLEDESEDAYEKQVDRLLASVHYGERMAVPWLDVSRYADTHGYHIDSYRQMWHWRDWVIDAFNRNKPFDRFSIEQLAGDLLPGATRDQKLATGFNRNHMINYEGGAIPEEYQNAYVVDRVDTTATVWMGLTMKCAQCHDHKYDPVSQEEFYRFYSFFNTIPEKGLDGSDGNAVPLMQIPTPDQEASKKKLESELQAARLVLSEESIGPSQRAWETATLTTSPAHSRSGLLAHYQFDGHVADTSGQYRHGLPKDPDLEFGAGRIGQALWVATGVELDLGHIPQMGRHDDFTLSFWVSPTSLRERTILSHRSGDGPDQLVLEVGRTRARKREDPYPVKMEAGIVVRVQSGELRLEQQSLRQLPYSFSKSDPTWHHVTIRYNGRVSPPAVQLSLDGEPAAWTAYDEGEAEKDEEDAPRTPLPPVPNRTFVGREQTSLPYLGYLDDLRVYARSLSPAEIQDLALHQPARETLRRPAESRTELENERLRAHFLTHHAPPEARATFARLQEAELELGRLDASIDTTMVMQEMDEPRPTAVLMRGDYRQRGKVVSPGVPAVLPSLDTEGPPNRLDLARWLFDPAHPLTARVAVNRFWQTIFGAGLVGTSEDLGSQGDLPSHPLLLDWLAADFVDNDWDIKRLIKTMVLSATYRQQARTSATASAIDPANRLLSRAPRMRLPSEMLRDQALLTSGLMHRAVGGPSVSPYQPPGLWKETSYGDRFDAQEYRQGSGQDLYRRSLYTVWKRTVPPPSMVTFDAPDREICVTRRPITNTPLQSLALMNDPSYVEASRVLAARVLQQNGTDAGRLRYAFRLVTSRPADTEDVQDLQALLDRSLHRYENDPEAAARLVQVGEFQTDAGIDPVRLAAWTTVASVLFNLDETISKQ